MPRIKAPPTITPTARKPVHFHVLLRSFLQKRFARCSMWTYFVCYIIAYVIGENYGLRAFTARVLTARPKIPASVESDIGTL